MKYIKKDITTVDFGIVAHGVNAQKRMNSGVAKAIRTKWPTVYDKYMTSPKGETMLGTAVLVPIYENDTLFVANCYTQLFYGFGGGRYASLDAVKQSMTTVADWGAWYNLPIYIPKIGCGLGGLDWETEVRPIIEELDSQHGTDIMVCEI